MMEPVTPSPPERAMALDLVRDLISRIFGVPPESVTAATDSADIERWDSLAMATLSLGIERRLNRTLPVEAFVAAQSVAELIDIICALDAAPAPRGAAARNARRHG